MSNSRGATERPAGGCVDWVAMGCVALVQIVAEYEEGEQLYLGATRYSVSFNLLPELPCLASVPAVTVTLESLLLRAPEPTLPEAAVQEKLTVSI